VTPPWRLAGPYVEACSCEAVCPCRRVGGRGGGRSTYGTCDFALGWTVSEGAVGELDVSGLSVVMAGTYDDDEPGSPWRVALYVDDRADAARHAALEDVFLGRAGGDAMRFAAKIERVYGVHRARVVIDHQRGRRRIEVSGAVEMAERSPVDAGAPVSCGIPGHDHPGEELIASTLRVDAEPLRFAFSGRCGFAADYAYSGPGDEPGRLPSR
jgi:hypothetical protein